MKKVIAALAFPLLVTATALAQEAPQPPTAPDVTAEANRLLAAVGGQRDACMNREAREAAEIDRLTREVAKAQESIARLNSEVFALTNPLPKKK